MSKPTVPRADYPFAEWATNFATTAAANASTLGLSEDEVAALTSAASLFVQRQKAAYLAEIASRTAFAAKREQRAETEELLRGYGRMFSGNPNLEPKLIVALGLCAAPTPSQPISAPDKLVVSGNDLGINTLKWDRAGNSKETMFIVECHSEGGEDWRMIGVTAKTSFEHRGQIPGKRQLYRVFSQRRSERTVPCPPVAVYSSYGVQAPQERAA